MQMAEAFSHSMFDTICENKKWDDDNVEALTDKAFISIIGTKDVQEHYLEENEEHWFKDNHPNVLNLEFDDVETDVEWDDYIAKAMTSEQAEQIVKFIESNLGKMFYIHCRAGMSRSQAIKHFIVANYEAYKDVVVDDYSTPNSHVLRLLNRILWNRKMDLS